MDLSDLPPHESISILHNWNRNPTKTVKEYLYLAEFSGDISEQEIKECEHSKDIWEVYLFPNSSPKYHYGAGSTLGRAIENVLRKINGLD
jgi:hypothetical protein